MFTTPCIRVFVDGKGYLDPKEFFVTPDLLPVVPYEDGYGIIQSSPDSQIFVERFVGLNENTPEQRKIFEGDIVCVQSNDPFDTLGVFYGEVIIEDGCAKALEVGGDDRITIFEDNFFRDFQVVGNAHGAQYNF